MMNTPINGPVDAALVIAHIKACRIQSGLSQKAVAERLSLTQQAYSKIESGRSRISLEMLLDLARLFEIEPATFFSRGAIFS